MFYFLKSVLWMIGLIFPFSSCLRTTKHNNNRDSLNTASGQAATHQPKQLSTVSTQIGVEEQEIDDIISRSTISSIQMKSDHEEGGEKNGKRMQTNAKANILLEPLEGEIALGTIKFNFKNILKGEPGVSGPKGPRGRQGMMGKRGQRGEKGEPGVLNTNNGPMAIRFRHVKEECTSECSGTVRLNENGVYSGTDVIVMVGRIIKYCYRL
ncbi:uncharacterized protein [Antedon mediterranea]|uniref:uncharacterized protein n=1 Tax=Antedon mediterranea TaxID=105859 RepID=UPI003AF96D52